MQPELKVEMGFVQRRLPWLVAGGAFLIYLVTLNHSSTFAGIASLAKAAGWDWRSNVVAPVHVLVTYPVRWLPAGLQLLYLNVVAAASAAAALGLLARSVALLPHDRTREQRALERSDDSMLSIRAAWVPPVLAALVCGLQLSFWENAVVATGDALDLLLFAWLVHGLLMYRLDQKESRLGWLAVVGGWAITNNYGMIALCPALLIALLWVKGLSFFNWRFLLRFALCGLAGLSLYLLLPLVDGATDLSGFGFWELLKSYWGYQKDHVLGTPRYIVIFSSFTSLVPALFMGIRWPATFGESSAAGNALTNLMTHVIHGVFLVACIYVAFDPPFSPRGLTGEFFTYTMLPLYYLGALTVGYCSGYLLLVFGAKPGPQAWQRPSALRRVANVVVVAAVWLALAGVPAGLIVQNLPTIWANAGKAMSRLAQHSVASLPAEGAYVLSDNSFSLFSVQYELLKAHTEKKYVLVDTTQLAASGYHRFMQKRHPDRWPEFRRPNDPKAMVDPFALIGLLAQMSARGKVYYLHPSFGYYFEVYYPTPHGLAYELKPFQDPMQASPPRLTPAELLAQDKFWESIRAMDLDPLIKEAQPFRKIGKGKPKPKTLGTYLAEYYSRSVNEFGVQAQRAGDLVLAAKQFDLALRLNPANPSAYVNQEYNRALQNHTATNYTFSQAAFDRTEMYGNRWEGILIANGPPDEPTACIFVSDSFQNGMNFRQAAQYLERVIFFDPTDRTAQINCMMMYVKAVMPDLALKRLEEFRARFSGSALKEDEDMDLIAIEAWARVTKNDLPKAESLLLNAQRQHPKQPVPWDTLSDIYMRVGQATNALQVLEGQLRAQPDSPRALVNYAVMLINLDRTAEALPYLERSLRLTPNNELALLNRGIANLRLERLDGAESDFLALLSSARSQYKVIVLYHLADTYFRKKNRRESLKFYHDFIKAAPPTTPEVQKAKERVRTLESGAGF